MAGVALGAALLLAAVSTPALEPAQPKQGELVVVRVAQKAEAVQAWFEGEPVPMSAVSKGWQGIFGLDLDAKPGPRAVTGVTVAKGKAEPWRVDFNVEDAKFPVQHLSLKDESKVNLSKKDLERTGKESQEVRALFRLRTGRKWSGTFVHPLVAKPEGGRFGSRRVINNEPRNAHTGADYGAPKGEHVRASNSGTVVLAADHFFAGKSVFIDHGDGLVTMYFHLDKILVEPGQTVKKGDLIGHVGSTGRSSGPHLHFGVNFRGARVNPASLLVRELE